MPQSKKTNDKVSTTAIKKAEGIQLAVDTYKDLTSGFSLRAAASLYYYLKNSIFNHFNDTFTYLPISSISYNY
jgi:hypothetical protein